MKQHKIEAKTVALDQFHFGITFDKQFYACFDKVNVLEKYASLSDSCTADGCSVVRLAGQVEYCYCEGAIAIVKVLRGALCF